jgi:hypothetical protein
LETLKLLAKIGIAGIITPKPTATRKEIEVSTETSRGSPSKGERGRLKRNLILSFVARLLLSMA